MKGEGPLLTVIKFVMTLCIVSGDPVYSINDIVFWLVMLRGNGCDGWVAGLHGWSG